MSAIYNLHRRQGQFSGFQDLILDLKMLRFSESLILLVKSSHIRPRRDIVSEQQTLCFLFEMLNVF